MAVRDGLAARRRAIGLTQDTLAEALRIERSTVARWEQGTSAPRPWLRKRLADVLELSPAELSRLLDPKTATTTPGAAPGDTRAATEPLAGHGRKPTAPIDGAYVESVRADGRRPSDLRPVSIALGVQKWAEGSCRIRAGDTEVLCAATIQAAGPRGENAQELRRGRCQAHRTHPKPPCRYR